MTLTRRDVDQGRMAVDQEVEALEAEDGDEDEEERTHEAVEVALVMRVVMSSRSIELVTAL